MIFSRYKRLGDDPDAIPPPPFGMPEDQYSPMPDGSPDYGTPPSDTNLGATGGTATGPAAQISQQPDPAPSMRADSMDAAKGINPIAGPPQPPPGLNAPPMPEPMRPVDPTGGNPLPKLPGMGAPAAPQGLQGVPQNPADIASKSLTELDALKAPDAPGAPKHWYSKLGTAIVNASSISPEQKQGLLHPVYSAQNAQYQGKVAGLQNKIILAEKLENVRSLDDARTEKADTSEQNAITNAAKQGIVFAPPGQTPPGDLVPTINPMAGRKGSPYANAQAFHDPNFGKFKVTAKQAELAGGALDGQVGNWLPMTELTGLIKAGAEQGKPVKETTVPVSAATAVAMHLQAKPNEDGTVEAPISLLKGYNTDQAKPEPKDTKLGDMTLLELRSQGKTTGDARIDALNPKEAGASLQRLKPPLQSNVTNFNLSPEAKQMLADQVRAGGATPSFGSRGGQAVADIYNQAAKAGPIDLAGAKQDYGANTGAIKDQEKTFARVKNAESTATKNIDLADSLSKKVDRTGSPLINKYLLVLKGQVQGDADTAMLNNAVETAANEYAGVVSAGSGGGQAATDSAREHARQMLHASMSDGTFQKVSQLMKQEMNNRRTSFEEGLKGLRGNRTGNQPQGQTQNAGAPKSPPPPPPPQQGDMIPAQIPGYPPSQIHRGQRDQFLRDHPGAMVGQ